MLIENFSPILDPSLPQPAPNSQDRVMSNARSDSTLVRFVTLLRINRERIFYPEFIENLRNQMNEENGVTPLKKMTREQVEQLQVSRFKRDFSVCEGEEEKCSICLQLLEDLEEIKRLPCRHLYHPLCIDTWLQRNCHCPVCKTDTLLAIAQPPAAAGQQSGQPPG